MGETLRRSRPRWIHLLGFGLAYLACAQASWYLDKANGTYVSIWLPAGFYLAGLLLAGTGSWPWLMLTANTVNVGFDIYCGTAVGLSLVFALANTVQAVGGAALVRRFVGPSPRLKKLSGFLKLVVYAVFVCPAFGATIGAAALVTVGLSHSYPSSWCIWWAGNAISILMVAPFVLAWGAPSGPKTRWWKTPARVLEAGLVAAGVTTMAWLIMGAGHGIMAPNNALLIPFILWAALRFGVRGAAAVNLLLALLLVHFSAQFLRGQSAEALLSGVYIYVLFGFLAFWGAAGLIPAIVIEERDQLLQHLGDSEDRFRNLAEAANEGIFITEEGRVLDVNDQALKLMGYTERAELIGRPVAGLVSEETRATVVEAIATHREVAYEHRLIRKDGSSFDAEAQAKIIRLGDRRVRMTAIRDISMRKQAQALLLGQQEVLEKIAAGRPLADTLPALLRLVEAQDDGLAGALLLAKGPSLHLGAAPGLPADFRRELDGLLIGEDGGSCGTAAFRREPVLVEDLAKDSRWAGLALGHGLRACWSTPILDRGRRLLGIFSLYGRRPGLPTARHRQLIEVATHLAAVALSRHHDEAALKLSDFSVQRAATATLWVARDARIIRVNRAACELFGHSEAELLARRVPDLNHHAAAMNWPEHWRLVREHQQMRFEKEHRHKDGHLLPVQVQVNWFEFDGEEYHFVFLEDLTGRRRLEEQVRQAQKLEAIGTLAGGIAHDFNNILTSLIGYTELARRRTGGDPVTREYLDAVLQGSARAVELVRQILIFSQREQLPRRPVQLREVVGEALKLLRATLPATIEFDVALDHGLPPVVADPTQIHQVVVNLCTNARQAIHDRPGRLTVRLEKLVVAGGPGPGPQVRLTVADTGCGMDPATLARMFEPFFTTKPVGKGTGLGLSVVHGIVQSHGGSIAADSRPGEGTVFHVYLPSHPGEAAAARLPEPGPESRAGRGQRILLVDDEKHLVHLGEAVLGELGYAVEGRTVPTEALAAVRAQPDRYDLVVTDYAMPGMNGSDLARQLKQVRPGLRIILSTGHAAGLSAEETDRSGFCEVLHKPYTGAALGQAVLRALGG